MFLAFVEESQQSAILIRAEQSKVGEHVILKGLVARELTAPLFAQHKIPRPQKSNEALRLDVERLALEGAIAIYAAHFIFGHCVVSAFSRRCTTSGEGGIGDGGGGGVVRERTVIFSDARKILTRSSL